MSEAKKDVWSELFATAMAERKNSPEIWAEVVKMAQDPEIAGLKNGDERGRAALRRLERAGLTEKSKAVDGLLQANTSPKGEDYDNPVRLSLGDIAKRMSYKDTDEMLGSGHGWWKVPSARIDSEFGEDAADVKNILRQATIAEGEREAQKGRTEAMNDGTASGWLARFMFPRVAEAAERGKNPETKDWGLDVGENVLSFVQPFGRIFGAARSLPRLGQVIAEVGENAGKFPIAGAVARRLPDAAFAPLSMEAADAAAYGGEDNDRGEFSLADPIAQTAFNFSLPFLMKKGVETGKGLREKLGGEVDAGKAAGEEAKGLIDAIEEGRKNSALWAGIEGGLRKLGKTYGGTVADGTLGAVPAYSKFKESVEEDEKSNRNERKKARLSSKADEQLGLGDLTDEDRKYLAYVKEHPDSVKFGKTGADRDRFNTWLLTRGNELGLLRPAFELEE